MTVLPRRVDTGGPRQTPDRKPKHAVSVRKAMGDRIAAAARAHGCSMADIVRAACADILGPEWVDIVVPEETFERMQAAAERHDCTVLDILHRACAGILSEAAR